MMKDTYALRADERTAASPSWRLFSKRDFKPGTHDWVSFPNTLGTSLKYQYSLSVKKIPNNLFVYSLDNRESHLLEGSTIRGGAMLDELGNFRPRLSTGVIIWSANDIFKRYRENTLTNSVPSNFGHKISQLLSDVVAGLSLCSLQNNIILWLYGLVIRILTLSKH